MLKRTYGPAAALVSCLLAGGTLGAQDARPNPLAAIKALKCSFPISAAGSWKEGEPQAQVKTGPLLTFQYTEIDAAESTARVIGLASSGHVVAQLFGANLHFLDMRATGSLMLTTVFGQESRDRKLKAVYTRADYLPISVPGFVNTPEVSQHYGECEVAQ
ncbi:MAG: hypothetical protein HY657_12910 [Acidobacteria bacterium]|nr:hypothetical protein [Acidobacteriota bacterium]